MSDIQFDEDEEFRRHELTNQKPYLVRLVLNTGIVSTDEQANCVLLGIAVSAIILAFFIPSFMGSSGPATPPPASQIIWVAGPDAVPGVK